jgi:hypothetical protein
MKFKLELARKAQTGEWVHIAYAWIYGDEDEVEGILNTLNQSAKDDFYWDRVND